MIRFPFDTKNLCGYLEAVAIETIIVRCACIFSGNFLSLGLGCFLFIISSIRDMKGTLRSINKSVKSARFVANRSHTIKRFSAFIHLHSKSRQLSLKQIKSKKLRTQIIKYPIIFCCFFLSRAISEFIEFYQPLVASTLVWSFTNIGVGMVLIEMQLV